MQYFISVAMPFILLFLIPENSTHFISSAVKKHFHILTSDPGGRYPSILVLSKEEKGYITLGFIESNGAVA